MPWPQRVHSGSPCRPLSGAPNLPVAGLRFREPPGPVRSPKSGGTGGMSQVRRSEKGKTSLLRGVGLDPGFWVDQHRDWGGSLEGSKRCGRFAMSRGRGGWLGGKTWGATVLLGGGLRE